eukprot:scaffold18904_cov112-Isochrysis_galbana.AAC.4
MCSGSEPRSAAVETDAPRPSSALARETRPVSAAQPSGEQRYGPPSVSTPAPPGRMSARASSSRASSSACHNVGGGSVVSSKSAPAIVTTRASELAGSRSSSGASGAAPLLAPSARFTAAM